MPTVGELSINKFNIKDDFNILMKIKAFTLIEILITISIIAIVMIGISGMTGNQVNKIREKIIKEEFVTTYNAVLLNSIGSSNVDGQGAKNKLVIYDGVVASTGFESRPVGDLSYKVMRADLPWNATIVFDNYGLGCSIDGQTGFQNVDFTVVLNNERKTQIGCFSIDLGTCKLIENKC